jgi:hypothetical protein
MGLILIAGMHFLAHLCTTLLGFNTKMYERIAQDVE